MQTLRDQKIESVKNEKKDLASLVLPPQMTRLPPTTSDGKKDFDKEVRMKVLRLLMEVQNKGLDEKGEEDQGEFDVIACVRVMRELWCWPFTIIIISIIIIISSSSSSNSMVMMMMINL